MSDWRSYDAIAEAYERRWQHRFEQAARHLLAAAGAQDATRLLDLGTGTAAVVSALGDAQDRMSRLVGCDLSPAMLAAARRRRPRLAVLVADVRGLPFRSGSFDLVTASCVLSHVAEYPRVLREALRVLMPRGRFAAASWGPASDAASAAWNELLGTAIGAGAAQRAIEQVAPCEAFFSGADNVRVALEEAGFCGVRVDVVGLAATTRVEDYILDRDLGASGRFGRHALGDAEWRRFLARAGDDLRRRFGDTVDHSRPIVIGIGAARA